MKLGLWLLLFAFPLCAHHDMPEIPEFPEEGIVPPTYEEQEQRHAEAELKKAQEKAKKDFYGVYKTNLAQAFKRYPQMEEWAQVMALIRVLYEVEPQSLTVEGRKALQNALLSPPGGRSTEHIFNITSKDPVIRQKIKDKWRNELGLVFPASSVPGTATTRTVVPLDEETAKEKSEKSEKGEYPWQRRGIYPSVEKAPATPEVGRVPRPMGSGEVYLYSSTNPNHKFAISRDILSRPIVSGRLSGALEDPETYEIPLHYPENIISELVKGFKWVKVKVPKREAVYVPAQYVQQVRHVDLELSRGEQSTPQELLADLLKAAEYEYSPLLTDVYARMYARYLHELKEQYAAKYEKILVAELLGHKFSTNVLRLIATQYFLQFNEGIDQEVLEVIQRQTLPTKEKTVIVPQKMPEKIISIPFALLKAYGKIPNDLLQEFPGLETDPNAVNNKKETALTGSVTQSPALVPVILRLPGIDVNKLDGNGMAPIGLAILNVNIPIITMLLNAGATATEQDVNGAKYKKINVQSPETFKLLEKNVKK